MRTFVTTRARSPLGTLLGLTLVTIVLVIMGMYLVTDGGFFVKLKEYAAVAVAKNGLTTLQENLKKYDRPQLITMYALMIVAGAAATGVIGSFVRTDQYRFVAGQEWIEKRALWAYMPLCVLSWFVLTFFLMLCDKWAAVALLRGILGAAAYDKVSGWLVPALWLVVSGGLAVGVLWMFWRRVQRWLGRSLFVPGMRSRVPFSNVKRMEIQNSGEGSTVLVLVLSDGSHWTIQSGRVKRLQRIGAVLSRMVGLERRDFVTWA